MSDPVRALRLTRQSHLSLLEEMRSRLSRLRASRFQTRVTLNEARRLREKTPKKEGQ
jgi:hypothetical protein